MSSDCVCCAWAVRLVVCERCSVLPEELGRRLHGDVSPQPQRLVRHTRKNSPSHDTDNPQDHTPTPHTERQNRTTTTSGAREPAWGVTALAGHESVEEWRNGQADG